MSCENIELLGRFLDAYNAHDIEALIAYCDPSIEFHSAFSAVGGADYDGHDGLRAPLKGYAHREDGLRDLGVSENELTPITP